MGDFIPLLASLFLLSPGTDTGGKGIAGQWDKIEEMARAAGMDPQWIRFLKAWAWHESRGNNQARNTKTSEAASARNLYVRNAESFQPCPFSEGAYSWGSGGYYGLLPVSAVWAFKGTPAFCHVNPRTTVFDPWESTLEAIDYARRSMQRDAFKERPTWKILNRATAAPTLMDERPGSSRYERAKAADDRFAKALSVLGIPAGFAEQTVSPLPEGWSAYNLWKAGREAATA